MAEGDAGDRDEYQHIAASSSVLVLSGLRCRFGPVGYRTPEGLFYWDLNHFFDALATDGADKTPQFKLITALQQLCGSEALLAPADLHCKRKTPRRGLKGVKKMK